LQKNAFFRKNSIFAINYQLSMKLFAAPLQGYTTAPWRRFHAEIYGAADAYFSPFLRVEKGEVRRHDLRDITSPLNSNHHVVPQIIFRDVDEFRLLVDAVQQHGFSEVDLNMGCPFPPQVKHGRGAAVVGNLELLEHVVAEMTARPDVSFSVKMRLGVDDPQQWRGAIEILNRMPLRHVTLHPRIARQQYSGLLDMGQFEAFLTQSVHPVIFNGELSSPADIAAISERFPIIYGVMVGRGLLVRPSLFHEFRSGEEWSREQQLAEVMKLHQSLFDHYAAVACGDAQLMSLIKPFWDYLEPLIGHKAAKQIRKATIPAKYRAALQPLMVFVANKPNEETLAAMHEAETSDNLETLDLKNFRRFVDSL
jgi:tRNA-dihydrouridine synthase